MSIKNTFFLTTLHTAIKILSGLVMNKVVAVYLGPSGLALIGQFQNFSGIVVSLSNASIQTGIVKKTSESSSLEKRQKVWANALLISVAFSLIVSLLVFLFAEQLAVNFLYNSKYAFIMQLFAVSVLFYSLNLYILSILNGLNEIKFFSLINICISLVSLVAVVLLTVLYQLKGALIGFIITQSFVFMISYSFVYKKYKNSFFKIKFELIDKKIINLLFKFGIASFISGVVAASVMLLTRNLIIDSSSMNDAGLWEAAIKMGLYFNLLFSLPISIHYLPKFSVSERASELRFVIKQILILVVPVMLIIIFVTHIFADNIISLLFSSDFLTIGGFLFIVLIAELLKVIASVFATLLIAKQNLLLLVINQILWGVSFIILAFLFLPMYGLQGIAVAYVCALFFFLIISFFSCRKYITYAR